MKWTYTPGLQTVFGACLDTVYGRTHLVMIWDDARSTYVVLEAASRREVARGRRKGECYAQLKLAKRAGEI